MARYYCLDNPTCWTLETLVIDAEPGLVVLRETPFYPGGGGQLPDRGRIAWDGGETQVVGLEQRKGKLWHQLADPVELPAGPAQATIDRDFRQMMCELHTNLHILNALVFQSFDQALVTGVQMNADGTARIDFDLQDVANDQIRALEPAIADAARQALPVSQHYLDQDAVYAEPGLIRSQSVAPPPTPDRKIRIVQIGDLDRQACGGTHIPATDQSRPVRILKVENKGRRNRRVRIGLDMDR